VRVGERNKKEIANLPFAAKSTGHLIDPFPI